MKTIGLTTLIFLLSISLFNYFVDCTGVYFRYAFDLKQSLAVQKKDEVILVPLNHIGRKIKKAFLDHNKEAEIVVLGSSRTLQLGGAELQSDQILNLSFSVANIDEYYKVFELMREIGFKYKTLIINLDYWQFNENGPNIYNEEFLTEESFTYSLPSYFKTIKILISFDRVISNIKFLLHYEKRSKQFYHLVHQKDLEPRYSAYTKAGELIYEEAYLKEMRSRNYSEAATIQLNHDKQRDYLFKNYSFSQQKLSKLKKMIKIAQSSGQKVIVSVVPFSPYYISLTKADAYLARALSEFQHVVINNAFNANFVCDTFTDTTLSCPEQQMLDATHPSKICLASFFAQCLEKAGLKGTLTH